MTTITIRERGIDIDELIQRAENVNGKKVIIGPKGSRNRDIAKVHEYGAIEMPVSGAFGEFWKRKTGRDTINIPERSFIRNGWDNNAATLVPYIERVAGQYATGGITDAELFQLTGRKVALAIQDYMRALTAPPNHPLVQEYKGFNDPLIHTGQLLASVDYEVQ